MQIQIRRSVGFVSAALALTLLITGVGQAGTTKNMVKSNQPHANITVKQAETIALRKFPGKIVQKTKLENEAKVWEYSVSVKSGKTVHEVMVNAKTGKIDNAEAAHSTKGKGESKSESGNENEGSDGQKK
ncbi:MAG: PepSY domain-containing protein [Armatimonadota bacterium]